MLEGMTGWYIDCQVCAARREGYGARSTTCKHCLQQGVKWCTSCKECKPLADFPKCKRSNEGVMSTCKECYRQKRKNEQSKKRANNETYRIMRNKQSAEYCARIYATAEGKAKITQRRHARRDAIGEYTTEQWVAALEHFEYQCAYCGETSNLTVEHIVPISKRGTSYIYNIIPACAGCNGSKGAKEIVEWYTSRDYYSEHRLLKIHAWYMDMQQYIPARGGDNQ